MQLIERVSRLEAELDAVERDQAQLHSDLKSATKALTDLTAELRLVKMELTNAINAVASNASRPFENLHWGWRVMAGIGAMVLGFATIISSLLGAYAYFRHH